MDDEAGLDRLAEPDFVGEQHARQQSAGDLGGDAELVGDQVDAPAHESTDARLAASMLVTEGGDAEVEIGGGIDVGRDEALLGSVEGEGVGEFGLGDVASVGAVMDEAAAFDDGVGGDGGAVAEEERIAGVEADASDGGVAEGVLAGLVGGAEGHGDGVGSDAEDGTEAQLGFGLADPALAGKVGNRHVAPERGRAGARRFKRRFEEWFRGGDVLIAVGEGLWESGGVPRSGL